MMSSFIVLQQIEVDSHDTILVFGTSQSFLGLLQYLTEKSLAKRCGSLAELIQIGLLATGMNRFRPHGGCEMAFRQQLHELFTSGFQSSLLVLVRGQTDNDLMFFLIHNECKGTNKRVKNQIIIKKTKNLDNIRKIFSTFAT